MGSLLSPWRKKRLSHLVSRGTVPPAAFAVGFSYPSFGTILLQFAFVAQLAERVHGKNEVSGSIPDEGSCISLLWYNSLMSKIEQGSLDPTVIVIVTDDGTDRGIVEDAYPTDDDGEGDIEGPMITQGE